MIGLEPWECLRAARLFGSETRVIVNRSEVPLLIARTRAIDIDDPVAELAKLDIVLQAEDYGILATEEFGDSRMMNYVIGRAAVRTGLPQFREQQFDECFEEVIANA